MKRNLLTSILAMAVCSVALAHDGATVATYPWAFDSGNQTSRTTAIKTVSEIASKLGYSPLSVEESTKIYNSLRPVAAARNGVPIKADLMRYGKAAHADLIFYGKAKWHTRSIWVGAGPKTISTATVDVYAFDVRKGKVVYSKRGVEGRSDEKENGLKVAGAVLLTPFVTAVSGGPATPREQRAVQVALGKAYAPWNSKRR